MKHETKAERADRLCQSFFESAANDDDGPCGACLGCEFLCYDYEDGKDESDMYWCVLAHGVYQDQNCHKCPGIKEQLVVSTIS